MRLPRRPAHRPAGRLAVLAGLLALLGCALAAAPAGAAAGDPLVLVGPANGVQGNAGIAPSLQVQSVPGDSGLELRISRNPQPADACLRIGDEVASARGQASP